MKEIKCPRFLKSTKLNIVGPDNIETGPNKQMQSSTTTDDVSVEVALENDASGTPATVGQASLEVGGGHAIGK